MAETEPTAPTTSFGVPSAPTVMGRGLLQAQNPTEYAESEKKRLADEEAKNTVLIEGLTAYLRTCFGEARNAKSNINNEIQEANLALNAKYDGATANAISTYGGSDAYDRLTIRKAFFAKAIIRDTLAPANGKLFTLSPTENPSLDDKMTRSIIANVMSEYERATMSGQPMQESDAYKMAQELARDVDDAEKQDAASKAKRMEEYIYDQMQEGGFDDAFNLAIEDFVNYPACILKGPIYVREKRLKWKTVADQRNILQRMMDKISGNAPAEQSKVPEVVTEPLVKFYAVDPLNLYLSPNMTTDINSGYVIEKVVYTRQELFDMKGMDGFKSSEIDAVISEMDGGALKDWTDGEMFNTSIQLVQGQLGPQSKQSNMEVVGLEFCGPITGKMLIDWGMTEGNNEPINEQKSYECWAILIGTHVIKATLNPHPLDKRPYHMSSFRKRARLMWGEGVPQCIKESQKGANSSRRSLMNNIALCSGPQVFIDKDAVSPGENIYKNGPQKCWIFSSKAGQSGRPIEMYQPDCNIQQISHALELFYGEADEDSGIPRYVQGVAEGAVRGAAGTAALRNSERIITPNGPVQIGSVRIGDKVSTTYGEEATILGVYPQGKRPVYRVKFSNNTTVDCDMEHRWSVRNHHGRKFQTLTLAQILDKGLFRAAKPSPKNPNGHRPKWMIPNITKSVYYSEKPVPIDAYTLGAILGDGDRRGRLTSKDEELFSHIPYAKGTPDKITRQIKGIRHLLRDLGLDFDTYTVFIPNLYLENSETVRRELLKGLMDTDGCIDKRGHAFYCTSSKRMAEDFIKLVKSLGGHTNGITLGSGRPRKDYPYPNGRLHDSVQNYRIFFTLDADIVKLSRKKERARLISSKEDNIYITGVEYIDDDLVTCITVDSKDNCYVCENFIVTHNTGLSMLMSAQNKGVKQVIMNIDSMIQSLVEYLYTLNMMDPNCPDDCKGDVQVVARGSVALSVKEQVQVRRMEMLQLVLNSQTLQGIAGEEGVRNLFESVLTSLDMPSSMIMPGSTQERDRAKAEALVQQAVEKQIITPEQAQMIVNPQLAEQAIMEAQAAQNGQQ